jgi:hypothetical protein
LQELTGLDEVVDEICGFVGADAVPRYWVTFRLAHSRCAQTVLDGRNVLSELANPDDSDDAAPA